jgi:hypothetical protein
MEDVVMMMDFIIIKGIGFIKKYLVLITFGFFQTKKEKNKNQDKPRPTTKSIQ